MFLAATEVCFRVVKERGWRPHVAAGMARGFHGPRRPGWPGRFLLPATGPGNRDPQKPGANTVTCGFPVMVILVAAAWRNFGRAF